MTEDKKFLGRSALLLATFIWGVSFVLMDFALGSLPPLFILAVRFSGAAAILLLAGARELRRLDMSYILGGGVMGAVLLAAYAFQTYGLALTTPGKNAFLTAVYCIVVPFLYWALERRRPDKYNIAAAFTCVAGIGLITLGSDWSLNPGDALTLACGLLFALHIVVCGHFVKGRSPLLLSAIQFAAAGAAAWAGTLAFEPPPAAITAASAVNLAFLTVMSTALCLYLQTYGQKHTPPSQAAVIMALEAVFGAAASVLTSREVLSARLLAGFFLTFAAVLISETKLSFLHRRRQKSTGGLQQ